MQKFLHGWSFLIISQRQAYKQALGSGETETIHGRNSSRAIPFGGTANQFAAAAA